MTINIYNSYFKYNRLKYIIYGNSLFINFILSIHENIDEVKLFCQQ